MTSLHPLLEAAAEGGLPDWTRAGPERREHMSRVADLMELWAGGMGLGDEGIRRWRAAGLLHDVLRDAPPRELVRMLEPETARLPGEILHGPAAAKRLRDEGVDDDAFLLAIASHTLGHPELDLLGRSLFAADFLEPGREESREWRGELRARMPLEYPEVVPAVAAARIQQTLARARPLEPCTVEFWNVLARETHEEHRRRRARG
jgi:HD superfamily phosphohydrolase YqeK